MAVIGRASSLPHRMRHKIRNVVLTFATRPFASTIPPPPSTSCGSWPAKRIGKRSYAYDDEPHARNDTLRHMMVMGNGGHGGDRPGHEYMFTASFTTPSAMARMNHTTDAGTRHHKLLIALDDGSSPSSSSCMVHDSAWTVRTTLPSHSTPATNRKRSSNSETPIFDTWIMITVCTYFAAKITWRWWIQPQVHVAWTCIDA